MRWDVLVLGLAVTLIAAAWVAPNASAQINADPCAQARVEWAAVQGSSDAAAVRAYYDRTPSACMAQRTFAETRLRELGAAPTGRARIEYECGGGETIQVAFDYDAGTAILSRYALRNVELQRVDASAGVRYVRGTQYTLEVQNSTLRIWVGESERYSCVPKR